MDTTAWKVLSIDPRKIAMEKAQHIDINSLLLRDVQVICEVNKWTSVGSSKG